MRRLITLLAVALSLLLVTAVVPAAAKPNCHYKPDHPSCIDEESEALYDVTLQITGEDGLGMCAEDDEPHFLTMVELVGSGASGSSLVADGRNDTTMPRLHLKAAVPWSRDYPEPASGIAFDGCHGGPLPGSQSDIPSYFIIHSDRDGNMSNVLWAFDVYIEKGTKGKNKTPGVKEFFRLWGAWATFVDDAGAPCPLAPLAETTCHVSGPFQVWHYYPIEQIGEPEFQFTMTITPTG